MEYLEPEKDDLSSYGSNEDEEAEWKEKLEKTDLVDFLPASKVPLDEEEEEEAGHDLRSIEEEPTAEKLSLMEPSQILLKSSELGRDYLVLNSLDKDSSLVNCRDEDGYSPLHRAAYNGHVSVVKILQQRGADAAARTVDGWQPLHCACRWGQTAVASLLLQNGVDINAQTNGKQTPLHFAASAVNGISTLQLLLCNRLLDPSLLNTQNETAYDIAKRSGHHHELFEIVEDCINVK